MENNAVIKVNGVSKKFCRSLKRSMWYGFHDILRDTAGLRPKSGRLRRKEFWAVDDVSFELKKGETLGLIGPNGAGKTTILKMLNGIVLPDKGSIRIKGRVGALIQLGAGFHPQLTGRENIYINGAILGMGKREIDKKFDAIVEFADIGDFLNTPVKFYSSGMFVRLGFAVAVHCEPDILVVDEVLAVGDTAFRRKSSERMKELIADGNTSIILVSHNMQTIEAIADKAILLNCGKILYFGNVNDVVAEYDLLMRPEDKKRVGGSKVAPIEKGRLELVKKYDGYAGDEVTIQGVWLESADGEWRTRFSSNEDVAVCVSYKNCSNITIQNGFVWVTFINEYNVNCMGARLRLGEKGIPNVLPESGILRVWFRPIQLTTSSYKISIAFFDKTYTTPYIAGHYGYIKIVNDIPTITPGVNSPVCWPPCEWNLEKSLGKEDKKT